MGNEPANTEIIAEFPAIYKMLGFVFPAKTRETMYQPAVEELKELFALAIADAITRRQQRWLIIIFNCRALILFGQSVWACVGGRIRRVLEFLGLTTVAEIVQRFLH